METQLGEHGGLVMPDEEALLGMGTQAAAPGALAVDTTDWVPLQDSPPAGSLFSKSCPLPRSNRPLILAGWCGFIKARIPCPNSEQF